MTDPVPFRMAVLDALAAGIAARVNATDDYINDLSEASFYGRATYGENDPMPVSNIVEDPRELPVNDTVVPGKGHEVEWKLILQGLADDDPAHPTAPAYRLAADLNRAVAAIALDHATRDDTILGGLRKTNRVEKIRIGAQIVRPPDEMVSKTYCVIPLTLTLYETPSAPFT